MNRKGMSKKLVRKRIKGVAIKNKLLQRQLGCEKLS